jgi:hypothetical protein
MAKGLAINQTFHAREFPAFLAPDLRSVLIRGSASELISTHGLPARFIGIGPRPEHIHSPTSN